jgi:uncharacterized membrane protein
MTETMTQTASHGTPMIATVLTLLIPLVCFIVVLLLLRFAAKARWLTAIATSVVVTTILVIFGFHTCESAACESAACVRPVMGWVFLLPAAIGALILAIQFFRWLLTTGTVQANDNTAERSRILKMVEDGKINTEEGSELLEAMGRSSALRGQDTFSRLDIAMLIGVALVILGFFLPWDYLGNRMYQAGHHRGPIGWAILIAAVLSAVPIFVTPKDMLYKISMLQIFLILVGLALVIKELTVGADQVGSIFCAVGFFVALLSSGVKLKSLAA